MDYKEYTWEETIAQVTSLGAPPEGVRRVYGPGNSGRILAEMFAALHGIEVADSPTSADLFLDDEVFTGATYLRLKRMFPEKPFWALTWNLNRVLRSIRTKLGQTDFTMATNDKGVVVNPRHRAFYPMKRSGRVSGTLILKKYRKDP